MNDIIVQIIAGLVVAILSGVGGLILRKWTVSKKKTPSTQSTSAALPQMSPSQPLSLSPSEAKGIVRLNRYVEEVKRLVREGKYKQAVTLAQKFREEATTYGDRNSSEVRLVLGELEVWYSHALMYTGETISALETLEKIIDDFKYQRHLYRDDAFVRWCLILGRAHNHIGYTNWMDLGHYEIALHEFYRAMTYFIEGKLDDELATDYDNIGRVYSQLGFQTRAKLLIDHGRQLRQTLPDRSRLALSLNSYAIAHLNSGLPHQAFNVNEEALMIFESQVEERGLRGKGLALLTKAHALRYMAALQRPVGNNLGVLDDTIVAVPKLVKNGNWPTLDNKRLVKP